jgi:hypothetical protein
VGRVKGGGVNWLVILARLGQIREKMERGEEPNEAEVAFVRALWRALRPMVSAFVETVRQAVGASGLQETSEKLVAMHVRERRAIAQEVLARRRA